jgi:hypothetical protein
MGRAALITVLLVIPSATAEACKYGVRSPNYDRAYDVGEAPRPGACEEGNPWDCEQRGLIPELHSALERACWLGDAEACYRLSQRLRGDDPDRAAFFFSVSCEGVFRSACWQSGGCDTRPECERWFASCEGIPPSPLVPTAGSVLGGIYFGLAVLLAILFGAIGCHRRNRPPPRSSS